MRSVRATPSVPVLWTARCLKDDVPANRDMAEHIRLEVEAWRDQGFPDRGQAHRYMSVPKMVTFHAPGGFRGIVWHERDPNRVPPVEAVWICAFGYEPYRGESGPNVYDWAAALDEEDPSRLVPQRADYLRYDSERQRLNAEASLQSARDLRQAVDAKPGVPADRSVQGVPCRLTSHDLGIYQLRVPHSVGEVQVRQILALLFSENVSDLTYAHVVDRDGRWRVWTFLIE